jgi:hypothetical protein
VENAMVMPLTIGSERQKIKDMQIGDYIKVGYGTGATLNAYGTFQSVVGTALTGAYSTTEIPLTGINAVSTSGYFYMVKVDKGLLVSDRVIHVSVTWDVLNTAKVIEGVQFTLDGIAGSMRSLTGGIAYADSFGFKATTSQGTKRAFPSNNEYDKYIYNLPTSLIQSGKTIEDVFHHLSTQSWCQDTLILSLGASSYRVARWDSANSFDFWSSATVRTGTGFRPVFDYYE